jgi:CMP-N,N'-diacetyllegionaminic acid synthase
MIVSIIPARGGSTEIKMKNIISLKQKPLIYYTINASKKSRYIDRTIVSTDNVNIAKTAEKFGSEVIMRPKKLSGNKISLEPTINHVLSHLKKEGVVPSVIVLLQNTSPLRTFKHIDASIRYFKKGKFDSILSGSLSHNFIWRKKDNKILSLNYNPLKRPNRQQMKNEYIENGAIYITKYSNFNKSKCRISGKIGLYEMDQISSLQIDSKLDLEIIEYIMKTKNIQ